MRARRITKGLIVKSKAAMLHRLFILCLFMVCGFSPEAYGQAYMTESGHAEFDSSVPLHSFTGESDYLMGKINLANSVVDFYLDVTTLKTGIGKRDKDMLETLEAEEYPFAEFYGKLTTPFDPERETPQKVTVEGEFTIHGVSRERSIEGTLEPTSEGLLLTSSWTINIEDYDIDPPGILFYRVSENIDIRIEATLKPTEQ